MQQDADFIIADFLYMFRASRARHQGYKILTRQPPVQVVMVAGGSSLRHMAKGRMALISYSSVAHMSMVIGGIITLSYWGVCRSFALMVAHGLCSSGLFCLSNISYECFGRRCL